MSRRVLSEGIDTDLLQGTQYIHSSLVDLYHLYHNPLKVPPQFNFFASLI